MYIRKTVDVYVLMGNYGYGWDYILYEETFGENETCSYYEQEIRIEKLVREIVG